MKALRVIFIITLSIINYQLSNAQIAINPDGATPDASAMLDITSTDKGILIPRMDSTNRKAISNPAIGLMVYDSTTNSFWYYANATWNNLNSAFLADTDGDTKIQIEENNDEDIIRFDMNGTEFMRLDSGRIEIVNTGNSVFIGEGAGANDDFSSNNNVFIGYQSGNANTTGSANVFLGYNSGLSNTTGAYNTFMGLSSGYSNTTGSFNSFMGFSSGYFNTSGKYNIFLGDYSGYYNTTGEYNMFLGFNSGYFNSTGERNIFLGTQSGYSNTTGYSNIFIGYLNGYKNTTGAANTFLGYQGGYSNTTGYENTFLGTESGYDNTTGIKNVMVGYRAGYNNVDGGNNIFLGHNAGFNETGSNKLYIANSNTSSPLIYGEFDNDLIRINGALEVTGGVTDADADTKIQVEESSDDDAIRFDIGGTESFVFEKNTNGISVLNMPNDYNVIIGKDAGQNLSTTAYYGGNGYGNVFLGEETGFSTTLGDRNIFIGNTAGHENTTGGNNIFLGHVTGYNNTTGNHNIFLGQQTGDDNTTGSNNIFLGQQSGGFNTTGYNNIFLGYQAGYSNTTGYGNIFLGVDAGRNETGSNKLYIENSNSSSPLIYGEFDNDSLQINGTLNINGAFAFPTTDGTSSQILMTDGNGTLSWQNNDKTLIADADADTKIQVEESSDDDIIRFDMNGTEFLRLDSGRIEIVNTGGSVFIGEGAGANDDLTSNSNVFTGTNAGYANTTGIYNTYIGFNAGKSNVTGGYNTIIGYRAGFESLAGGYNTFIGQGAGYFNTTGVNNVFLGNEAGFFETGSNKLYIANSNTSTPLIYGEFDNDLVTINGQFNVTDTVTLSSALMVNGQDLAAASAAFTTQNGVISTITNGDDFIVGVDNLEWESGNEEKLFFDKGQGAFRAGRINNSNWDNANLGDYSFAAGTNTMASGTNSTALGYQTIASEAQSFAGGNQSEATANLGFAFGKEVKALSFGEVALGLYNTTYTPNDATDFDANDRLFSIGNGTADGSRSDAMAIYKNGKTEINGQLTVEDDFLAGDDNLSYGSGDEYKVFFDQSLAAFRVGRIQNTNWDETNLGGYSFATGTNTIASGNNSAAFGYEAVASGVHSIAGGNRSEATGAISFAYGREVYAPSYGEVAFGLYGTTYTPTETSAVDEDDRLFSIGNGTGSGNRSDAMVVYKSGKTELKDYVTIQKSIGSLNAFPLKIENTNNANNAYNNGLQITAGQDASVVNNSKLAYFIQFATTDGTEIGSIRQASGSDISFNTTSDIRLKTNVRPSGYGLQDILNIDVRDYHYTADASKTPKTGFLAQQLYEVFPTAVTKGGDDAKTNPWTVDYSKLTPLLVKGMQDQQTIIEQQNQKLEQQNLQIQNQQSEIEQLKAEVDKINALEAKLEVLLNNQ